MTSVPRFAALMRRLSRDYAFVLPGLPIAVFSFSLLLSLLAISIVSLTIWVGALLLPVTLMVASGFAELDRNRLRLWGAGPVGVKYRRAGPGALGKLRIVLDPRRWLDLVFEMLLVLPLRLVTFVAALTWTIIGPGGLTYFIWSVFIPDHAPVIAIIEVANPALVPSSSTVQYLIDSGAHFLIGLLFLVTLPAVMRALAGFDAMLTTALLGAEGRGVLPGHTDDGAVTPRRAAGHHTGPHESADQLEPSVSFSPWAWSWIGAGFAAVVLVAVGWPLTSGLYQVGVALAMTVVVAHCGSIVLTLRWVWAGLGLSLAASAATMWVTASADVAVWPWPVTTMITQCAVLIVAALSRPWYGATAAWGAGAVMTLIAILSGESRSVGGSLATGIVFVTVSGAVVVIGVLARLWIRNVGQLEEATRSSAEQGRRRHELEERNRIARELHDVVAHSMSVISVQAATAQYRNPDISGAARREFDEIAESSRQALSEMRMLLTILRGGDEARTTPEPGLADIGALVDSTRASGTAIRYSPPDTPMSDLTVGSSTQLIAYRTVQEALSNALRHAPGAAVEVQVSVEGNDGGRSGLIIDVVNAPPPDPGAEPAPGAGLGLAGIRERAEAVGGTVEARATAAGGFSVRATLPI